ncbi:hypothetical protein JOB18_019990 [Solea senegalensis]|uniref:Uncharacterized protein n=1 Tax=Solea senegalensis TaxID=28829 RepID=A0AAV6S321_SOLSE|nr:hypothetical protein JOB18_019990 [Solea senegalensis]
MIALTHNVRCCRLSQVLGALSAPVRSCFKTSSYQPLEIPEENPAPSTSTAQWTVRSAILDGLSANYVQRRKPSYLVLFKPLHTSKLTRRGCMVRYFQSLCNTSRVSAVERKGPSQEFIDLVQGLNPEATSHERVVATVTDNGPLSSKHLKNLIFQQSVCVWMERVTTTEKISHLSQETLRKMRLALFYQLICDACAILLSLVATIDAKKAMKAHSSLSRLNNSTMGKCSALWNAAGRPKSAEVVSALLKFRLTTPCATRRNSLYDSLHQLCSIRETLPELNLS